MSLLGVTNGAGGVRVDWRTSLSLIGTVLKYLAVPLLLPLIVGLIYGGDVLVFLCTGILTLVVGTALERLDPDPDLGAREGFLLVAGAWLGVALISAVPYLLAAHGLPGLLAASSPASTLANPVNALFESMSGFTTTGATLLGEISLDRHSHAILIWRQLTQWLGGMGIIVLAIAILPELSVGGAQLMDAEAPGVGLEKLTPRIAETARVLWIAYFGFTALEIALLYGLHLAGMAPDMGADNAACGKDARGARGGNSEGRRAPVRAVTEGHRERATHPDRDKCPKRACEELLPVTEGKSFEATENGIFVFTPDGMPVLGETNAVDDLWTALAIWWTHSGGYGKILAEWMETGVPTLPSGPVETGGIHVDRFGPHAGEKDYFVDRGATQYRQGYKIRDCLL